MRETEFAWVPDSAPIFMFLYHPVTLNKEEPMTCFQPTQYANDGVIVVPMVVSYPTRLQFIQLEPETLLSP